MSGEIATAAAPPEAGGHAAVDSSVNPWPGLASYTEDQRHLFFGRTAEINEVVRLIGRETLTVLFGRSGLGKSSLLRAGVMPRLREQGFFPVTLRLDFSERAEVTPVEQVKALTLAAARAAGVEPEGVPGDAAGLTLWEWFHTVEFWGPRNDPVTPILALDQFEEVFTLGRGQPRADAFIEALADLIENRVPQAVRERAQASGERLAYDATRQDYKVVLSLREDFVPRLDSLRPVLPAIMRNRFALHPLAGECACAVVLGAGGKYVSGDDAKEIVAAVVGGDGPLVYRPDGEVEPAYLSVMCHELFRRMQALGRNAITRDLIDAERGGILEGLYTRSFEGIGDPVRFFVEDRLLTPSGYRGTLPLADATQEGIAESDLETLVDRRLLRFEDRLGTIHLELSHDLLTRIVLKRRESRRAEAALRAETERAQKFRAAQLAQRRRSRFVAGVAGALAALLIGTLWGVYYFLIQEHRASYRNVGSRHGFPEGIGELSPGQVRGLPVHYVLTYKGIAWDGWRPHWKPAFKLTAEDQRGRLTIKHGIGTYLWRAYDQAQSTELNKDLGQALGLGAVCQWECTADAEGNIASTRGLDRDGHMVWGCIYSPATAGGGGARIAHYIGPDGFPQLQNTSAAEYIEIHYDAAGWESRLVFLDAMARPAPGPDGEFGNERQFDRSGNIISAVVLDEHGRPMIDRTGNAGLRVTYGADGLAQEVTSLGTDGQPFASTDGWTRIRDHYDASGRRTRIEAYDADGKPVLRRANFWAIENTYDDRGNLVQESYLDTDGKPRRVIGEVVAIRRETDAAGNESRTTYVDADGKPSRIRDGSCGYESRFDARGNLIARTLFGADGKPFLIADGYASWRSDFDDQGKVTRCTYYGVAGEPVVLKKGGHGNETRYDLRGNPVRYSYLGTDGRPAFATDQVAGWEAEFDQRGRETLRRYFGLGGVPAVCTAGYHALATSYDERGYPAEYTYLNLEDQPVVPPADSYASQKVRHDTQGRETRRTFYNASDKAVANKDGVHGFTYQYDERGNVTGMTTINIDGLPVAPKSRSYARVASRYDAHAYLVEQHYFDAAGKAAKNDDGVCGARYAYTTSGTRTEQVAEGAGPDEPATDRNGVARQAYEYDGWGRQTKLTTFGARGEPVPGVDEAFAKTSRYDAAGNWTGSTWLDADGKPTACDDGYAEMRVTYDERNNEVGQAYLDAAGRPCLGEDETCRWLKKFNARRDVLSWEFFGVDDRPVVGAGGYAATVVEYDARGDETSKTFLGADGKPMVRMAGYATIKQAFGDSGLLKHSEFYDAAGQPALCEEGYCASAREYDAAGRPRTSTWTGLPGLTAFATKIEDFVGGLRRSERYLGADGKPVDCSAAYAQVKVDYNEAGTPSQLSFRDARGKPAYGSTGVADVKVVNGSYFFYDIAGEVLRDGEPRGTRPLLYVNFVRSAGSVWARCGVLPGDIVWQVGNFSYPQLVEDVWLKSNTDADAESQMYKVWKTVLTPTMPLPVRGLVIRQGKPVELSITDVADGGIGVRVDIRKIPTRDYEAMVLRYGKPGSGSPPPTAAP